MVKLGIAAKYLRERLGLSQRAAARELGISHVHLNNIENGRTSPTAMMIERYYEKWKIDLYMLAVAKFSDDERVPTSLRHAVDEMIHAWDVGIESRIRDHGTDVVKECLESNG